MRIGEDARVIPNQPATLVALCDGMRVGSLNCWPNVNFDVGRVNDFLSALLPAGFYYKTFMWPGSAWMAYEAFIRRAAGIGRTPEAPDPDRYEKRNASVDVLVIGGGSTGIAAALAAGRAGARVMVCERDAKLGGQLGWRGGHVCGNAADTWLAAATAALRGMPNVQILMRTTAVGYYDHNLVTLVERMTDHLSRRGPRATRAPVEAACATRHRRKRRDRAPVRLPGNDLPGVMLASAAQRYLGQFARAAGTRAVVFTNNDSAHTPLHTRSSRAAPKCRRWSMCDRRTRPARPRARAACVVGNDAVVRARSGAGDR